MAYYSFSIEKLPGTIIFIKGTCFPPVLRLENTENEIYQLRITENNLENDGSLRPGL